MKKFVTCIVCPNGCEIECEINKKEVTNVKNALCNKGKEYAQKEILNPERVLTSTVKVSGGDFSVVSVRTDKTIPRALIIKGMKALKKSSFKAPIKQGQILIEDFIGLQNVNIISTSVVNKIIK